jgi:hypothetical protein
MTAMSRMSMPRFQLPPVRRLSSATTPNDIIQNTPKELPVKKVEFVVGLAATVAGAAVVLEAAVETSETGLDVLNPLD